MVCDTSILQPDAAKFVAAVASAAPTMKLYLLTRFGDRAGTIPGASVSLRLGRSLLALFPSAQVYFSLPGS